MTKDEDDDGNNHKNYFKDSNPSSLKRPRRDDDDTIVWDALKRWIGNTPGGFCHDGLQLDDDRTLITVQDLPRDTTVMIIPATCTVTAPLEWQNKVRQATANNINIHWHHPVDDLLVAWNLVVYRKTSLQVYWDSLPAPERILGALPRAWPVELRTTWLQGSPLLRRIHRQSTQLRNDYESMVKIMESKQPEPNIPKGESSPESTIPTLSITWNEFDQAMAIVTSRAFAGPALDMSMNTTSTSTPPTTVTPRPPTVCCIPLLDLGNHIRGNQAKPNLRYAWNGTTSMVVHTRHGVLAGTPLSLTYGAQSNAQLLLNYGFCLPNNVEPDGSSNNTYELYLPTDTDSKTTNTDEDGDNDDDPNHHCQETPIVLRLGPKSYTYGPLVQVLHALTLSPQSRHQNDLKATDSGNDDDMEAFLNECEDDDSNGEQDEDADAYLYMGITASRQGKDEGDGDVEDDDDDVEQQKAVDLQALKIFQDHLVELLGAYPSDSVARPDDPRTQYAQLLLESEKEILHFYLVVVRRLLTKLNHDTSIVISPLDDAQAQLHADSLVEAFCRIRYTML